MKTSPRDQFLRAREFLRVAEEAEETAAKATDGVSEELSVARTGVRYARREFGDAERAYAAATRAELAAADPEFAALVRNADDARAAAEAAYKLFRSIRDVYHAASAARPAGFREAASPGARGLAEGAAAYGRITARVFRLHGQALADVKADLDVLMRLATDCEGRVALALEEHAEREADDGERVAG